MGCPVATSQSRTVLSRLAVNAVLPSGLNPTLRMALAWENAKRTLGFCRCQAERAARAVCCQAGSLQSVGLQNLGASSAAMGFSHGEAPQGSHVPTIS